MRDRQRDKDRVAGLAPLECDQYHAGAILAAAFFAGMIVTRIHAGRRLDFRKFLVTQFRDVQVASHATAHLFKLIGGDKIADDASVAGHRNGFTLGLQFVAAEIANELGGRNGLSHIREPSLLHPNHALCAYTPSVTVVPVIASCIDCTF